MDCNLSRIMIALGRRELTVADAAALDGHIVNCAACAVAARQSFAFDEAVSRVMTAVPVPPGLRASLMQTAYARRGHEMRRKIYQWSALAAAVLVAIGIGFGGYWQSRPSLDLQVLAERTESDREHSEQAVHAWLAAKDLPAQLPYEFDFRLYMSHGKEEIAGRDVPVILFAHGRDVARVYFVRKSQFNVDKAAYARTSFCTVEVFADRHPEFVIVVSYTTDRIDPFLRRKAVGQVA